MKGYISQYKKSNFQNLFDEDIFVALYQSILNNCFSLIQDGYIQYITDSEKLFLPDETQITAGICGHIEDIINKQKLPFDIVPEFFVYSNDIRKGKKNPKRAKRFDLKITTWNQSNEKFKFGVEAKLLAENNHGSKIATTLIKEYVEDAGMGKFINNIYDPNSYNEGVMLGHILNGEVENIMKKINDKITSTYSNQECLSPHNNHYVSNYADNGKKKNLYHIFLNFSTLANNVDNTL